jgi:CPA2 family monovalent cation:H+ antiporter-2
MRRVIRIVQDQRDARYNLLRGFFHGADDNSVDERLHERLASVTVPAQSRATRHPLGVFALQLMGVRVVSLRHSNGKVGDATDSTILQDGDTLVLSGKAEALALAEQKLLKGSVIGSVG